MTTACSYERSDGSTGQTGALALQVSQFFTEFTDTIEIPESHQGLPDMHGSAVAA